MDKQTLLTTANKLRPISSSSAEEYTQKMEQLIAQMNTLMLEKANIQSLIGENNMSMMKDNNANHVRFMASIFTNYKPEVFVETVLWVFRAYPSHGFTSNYFATQLNAWIDLTKKVLTPECYIEIYSYYEWMQINIPIFVKVSDETLNT